MFINCPNCNALVATDLVTDLPPPQCPRCDVGLRDAQAPASAPAASDPATPVSRAPLHGPASMLPDASVLLAPPAAPTPPASAPEQGSRPAVRFVPLHEPPRGMPPTPLQESRVGPAIHEADDGIHAADTPPASASGTGATDHAAPASMLPLPAPLAADAGHASASTLPPAMTVVPAAADVGPPTPEAAVPAPSVAPPAASDPAAAPMPAAAAPVSAQATPAAPAGRAAPSFLRPGPSAAHAMSPRERQVLRVAIPALAVLLVVQLLLADRVRLAGDATWRPWVAAACTLARCTLPPWHAPDAIALVQRDVRPHPGQPGALQVSATLRNDAAYPQAWPMLLLTLSDVDGRPMGARWFTPEEYRPADAAETLAPGAAAAFRIDVVEPSPHTVAFNFAFG